MNYSKNFFFLLGSDITRSEENRNKLDTGNGTLILNSVQHSDSGYYECEAFNGIGNRLKKTIHVKVSGKVSIEKPLSQSHLY